MAMGTRLQWRRPLLGFDLAGCPELVKALEILEQLGHGRRVLEKALKHAAKPMVTQGRNEAPVRKGILRGAVQLVKAKIHGRHQARFFFTCSAPHAHLVHDGTAERYTKKMKRSTGRIATPNPFMQRAYDAKSGEVLTLFAVELGTELLKLTKRIQRRLGKGTLGKGMTRRLTR